jgi:hypothetical protein
VQERARNTPELISIGNDFLNGTSVAQQLREWNDKKDYKKLNFFIAKEMVIRLKRKPTE